MCLLSDCIVILTTSKGLTKNDSVIPAQMPASEKVYDRVINNLIKKHKNHNANVEST